MARREASKSDGDPVVVMAARRARIRFALIPEGGRLDMKKRFWSLAPACPAEFVAPALQFRGAARDGRIASGLNSHSLSS